MDAFVHPPPALGDLHINTKHIFARDKHYYIAERFEKLSDGLYIRDGVYINLLLPVTGTTGTR